MRLLGVLLELIGLIRAMGKTPRPAEHKPRSDEEVQDRSETSRLADAINAALDTYRARQTKQDRDSRTNRAIATGAVVVALLTMMGVGFQWNEMRKAVEISSKALDTNERAWLLGATSIKDAANGQMTAVVEIRNAGKAPAFYARLRVVPTKTATAPVIELPLGGTGSEISLGPGDRIGPIERPLSEISKTYSTQVRQGDPLYVWLGIKYSDPFSGDPSVKDRYTQECWFYDATRQVLVVCPTGHIHR